MISWIFPSGRMIEHSNVPEQMSTVVFFFDDPAWKTCPIVKEIFYATIKHDEPRSFILFVPEEKRPSCQTPIGLRSTLES